MTAPIRVLCVDDSERLRAAWARLFELTGDIELVGSLDRADDLVATAIASKAEVILMDLSMPGRNPFEVIGELAASESEARVLVCTGKHDPELRRRALEAGAWDFVDKAEAAADIVGAIRRVATAQAPAQALPPGTPRS